jgi:hypothetical protein
MKAITPTDAIGWTSASSFCAVARDRTPIAIHDLRFEFRLLTAALFCGPPGAGG